MTVYYLLRNTLAVWGAIVTVMLLVSLFADGRI